MAGFTILELMITVSVLGILLGVGVPAFTDIIRRNRLVTESNELMGALGIARSEAVKLGSLVSICAARTDTQTDCATTGSNWSNGWIVFSDDQGAAGAIDADGTLPDDTVIQRWPGPAEQRIGVTTAATRFIQYRPDGSTTQGVGASTLFALTPNNCTAGTPDGARQLTVIAAGRANVRSVACP